MPVRHTAPAAHASDVAAVHNLIELRATPARRAVRQVVTHRERGNDAEAGGASSQPATPLTGVV
jgi:hypothetical protein